MKSCKKSCRSGRKMRGGMNGPSKMGEMEGKVGGTRRRRRK